MFNNSNSSIDVSDHRNRKIKQPEVPGHSNLAVGGGGTYKGFPPSYDINLMSPTFYKSSKHRGGAGTREGIMDGDRAMQLRVPATR